MLDNHVISLVRDCDMSRIEDLILLGYDRLMKAKDKDGVSALGIARGSDSTQLKNTLDKFYDVQVRFDKMKIYSIFNTKLSVQLHKHSYLSILIYCTYITTCTRRLVCRIWEKDRQTGDRREREKERGRKIEREIDLKVCFIMLVLLFCRNIFLSYSKLHRNAIYSNWRSSWGGSITVLRTFVGGTFYIWPSSKDPSQWWDT